MENINQSSVSISNSEQSQDKTSNSNRNVKKRSWTSAEDEIIKNWVAKNGPTNWQELAKFIPNRTDKQCRERFRNYLDPTICHDNWTDQNDWLLYLGYIVHGPKWSTLNNIFTNRTAAFTMNENAASRRCIIL